MEPRVFGTIRVQNGVIAHFDYEEALASLLGSHKRSMVDPRESNP
jgi:hypothetical protein